MMTDFPGGPVVKTSLPNARGMGSIPGWGARIPHAFRPENQNTKHKIGSHIVTNFIKT